MPTFTQPRTASILSDKTTFASPEDEDQNQFFSNDGRTESNKYEGYVYDIDGTKRPLSPEAQVIYDKYIEWGIPVSYIDDYDHHPEESHYDIYALSFKRRYVADDQLPNCRKSGPAFRKAILEYICFHLSVRPTTNYGGDGFVCSTDSIGFFNIDNGRIKKVEADPCFFAKEDMPFIRRLGNVAWEMMFSADGGAPFKTQPRGVRVVCCPNCETQFRKSGYIEELGPRGTEHGWESADLYDDPNEAARRKKRGEAEEE